MLYVPCVSFVPEMFQPGQNVGGVNHLPPAS
jgi:hypothetical protein